MIQNQYLSLMGSRPRTPAQRQRWVTSLFILGMGLVLVGVEAEIKEADHNSFRIAFSSQMFTQINENDAKAAIKVWAKTVAQEQGIPTDPDPRILGGIAAMATALETHQIDAVGLSTVEYLTLKSQIGTGELFVGVAGGSIHDVYLLLAQQDSQFKRIDDLQNHRLIYYEHQRTCLMLPWLQTLVGKEHNREAGEYFSQFTASKKLSKAILPVFFKRAEACLVHLEGFQTMAELNPQIGRQLRVLATSPEVVPTLLCIRSDYQPPFKEKLLRALAQLHESPAGKQVLTIFQLDRLDRGDDSCLESARRLMASYQELTSRSSSAEPKHKTGLGVAQTPIKP